MNVLARWRTSPGTSLTIVVLSLFLAATIGASTASNLSELRRAWGSVERLTWVAHAEGPRPEVWFDELYGPFDVWDGQWWRVPVSTLHHADLVHFFLNALFIAVYGPLLERRWGSFRFLLFLVCSALASAWPEYLLDEYAVGFSGVCCAVFGALIRLRQDDPLLATVIRPSEIGVGLGALAAMWVLTELGVLQIANYAHLAGLAYGYLVACVVSLTDQRWMFRTALVLGHLLLVVPYWLIVSPVQSGRYAWYLATVSPEGNPQFPRDLAQLRRAISVDPSLGAVWLILAQQAQREGKPVEAWTLMLSGLKHQPSHKKLWDQIRPLWRRLAVSAQRAEAEAILERTFGETAPSWLAEIRRQTPPPLLIGTTPATVGTKQSDSREDRVSWSAAPDDGWWRLPRSVIKPFTPDSAESASEGCLL